MFGERHLRDCSPSSIYIHYFIYGHVAFVLTMSTATEANRLAAKKAVADKKAAKETDADAVAAASS